MNDNIEAVLHEALMCSLFASPRDPGLTYDEALEVGRRFGFLEGELADAAQRALNNYTNNNKYIPTRHAYTIMLSGMGEDPELIDYDAIDFVYAELNYQVRSVGVNNAKLDRSVIVERAVQANLDRNAVESAITCYVFSDALKENNGCISFSSSSGTMALPGQLSKQTRLSHSINKPHRTKILTIVRDIVSRRTDGRSRQVEAFDAFEGALERIGFKSFRIWWSQSVKELKNSDFNSAPISCVVLSAALVEGALTFAARHARDRQLDVFRSNDFDGDPRTWKAEKLIDSASRGGAAAIFTPQIKARAEHLNRTRQRVHVGRLLSENPGGVPDLRPEEGRDAKATAEQVVRAILDWLENISIVKHSL